MDSHPRRGRLVRVTLPHAVFGLIVRDHVIVEAAPIAAWSVGRHERVVAEYLRRQGATFDEPTTRFRPGYERKTTVNGDK